jgi:hypothetical protein
LTIVTISPNWTLHSFWLRAKGKKEKETFKRKKVKKKKKLHTLVRSIGSGHKSWLHA